MTLFLVGKFSKPVFQSYCNFVSAHAHKVEQERKAWDVKINYINFHGQDPISAFDKMFKGIWLRSTFVLETKTMNRIIKISKLIYGVKVIFFFSQKCEFDFSN